MAIKSQTSSKRLNPSEIKPDERTDRDAVQAVARAVDLLELLADNDAGLRLVDIAEKSGMATSTVHRLLTTLEARRFVYLDKQSRAWNIGGHCFSVAAAFGRKRRLAAMAAPVMRRLLDRSRQTVNLALADADRMTLLYQTAGRDLPEGIARPGAQSAITRTALGQSVIAALPDTQIDLLLRSLPSVHADARGDRDLAGIIKATRQRRFAVDDEVNAVGLRCVAAPIFDEFARPIAALSIAGATRRIDFADLAGIGREVLAAAAEVTQAIGGCAPGWTAHAGPVS